VTTEPIAPPSSAEEAAPLLPAPTLGGTGGASTTGAPPLYKRLLSRLVEANPAVVTVLSVFTALVFGGVLIDVTSATVLHAWSHVGSHPGRALSLTISTVADAYGAILSGSVLSPSALGHAISTGHGWTQVFNPLSETCVAATPLILAGVGVAIGFRTGVFNIGAQGQLIAGSIVALYVGFAVHLPIGIHLPLVILAGAAGGAAAGLIPGILKARTGAHEVIVTIMLNYVFLNLLNYILGGAPFQLPGQTNEISQKMLPTARMPHLFGSSLRVNLSFVIAIAMAALASWFMNRSTLGFSFKVSGANANAARTAGMSSTKVTILVFAISGLFAGMAGMATLSGTNFFLSSGYGGTIGFNAITVALLGRNRPWGVVWASMLFALLDVGGASMQIRTGITLDLTSVIQATIIFFIATPMLVREIYRLRSTGAGALQLFTKGWSG
jgi:general nucleoside transport system permease protein